MAVRMSDAKINHELSDNLNNTTIDVNSTGNAAFESTIADSAISYMGNESFEAIGVSTNMVSGISHAIDEYEANIRTTLGRLEAIDSQGAFKGTGVTEAVSKFVTGVKETANSYLKALKESQVQIIESVKSAYETQDSDISSNVKSDEATVTSAMPK